MAKANARTICTAQYASGSFCEEKSIPDAPFPICIHHAAKLMAFLGEHTPNDYVTRMAITARALEQRRERDAELARRRHTVQPDVVYYLRVGQHVKIGYTSNLRNRLTKYPPDSTLLAVEPGSKNLEYQRHKQFAADLNMGNEWFRPSAKLMAHIAELRAARAAA